MTYALIALPLVALVASVFFAIRAVKKGAKTKTAVLSQLAAFAVVAALTFAVPMVAAASTTANAADTKTTAAATAEPDLNFQNGLGLLAAGLVTGLSGIGGGIAVGGAAPAAIGATSEDPKAFGKALIFVALGEGIALYGLLMSILILGKVK